MPKRSRISVLVLANEGAGLAAGLVILNEGDLRLRTGDDASGAASRADVLVAISTQPPKLPEVQHRRIARGETGLIVVGAAGPADVVLPADATPREIVLACRLLGQVVRLRRQVRWGQRRRRRLSQWALTDALTGLPNRRAWQRELRDRCRSSAADVGGQCLAIIDLDHFKVFNDSFGHVAGDRLLRAVGETLERAVRGGDFVARLGGDEFGVLLAEVEAESASAIVERIRQRIASDVSGLPGTITASSGYVFFGSGNSRHRRELFDDADQALMQAKSGGRDRSVAASPEHRLPSTFRGVPSTGGVGAESTGGAGRSVP